MKYQAEKWQEKYINMESISWSNTKFSKLTKQELYGKKWEGLLIRSKEWKGWIFSQFDLQFPLLHALILNYKVRRQLLKRN